MTIPVGMAAFSILIQADVGAMYSRKRANRQELADSSRLMQFRLCQSNRVKKLKNEAELFKAALEAGVKYGEERGVVEFEATDSASDKALYIYRLLVHDKLIAPLPEAQVSQKSVRHRLAMWHARQLPVDHPLLE